MSEKIKEKIKDPKKIKRGKKSKAQGAAFELRVRKDLEEKGWVVDKWSNNVSDYPDNNINLPKEEREDRKLISAKAKWAGPNRPMMIGAGFPDFIIFRALENRNETAWKAEKNYAVPFDYLTTDIIGVESKLTGELDREEKDKCKWLLENKIFSKILIAEKTKVKNRVVIVYHDFKEKYWRFFR